MAGIIGEDEWGFDVQRDDGSVFKLPRALVQQHMAQQAPPPVAIPPSQDTLDPFPDETPPMDRVDPLLGKTPRESKLAIPEPAPSLPVPSNPSEAMAGMGEANRRVREASDAKRRADADASADLPARLHAKGLPTPEEALEEEQTRMAANEAYRAQRLATVGQEAQLLREEVKRFGELKPEGIFQRAPTWGKILMGIAMIAGGAASGYANPRGENPFLKTIRGIINDDLEQQNKNIARKGAALDARLRENREARKDAESEFEHMEIQRAKAWELVKQRVDLAAKSTTSEQGKADLALASAQAEAEISKNYLDAAMKKAQLDVSEANSKRSAWVQKRGQDFGFVETNMKAALAATQAALDRAEMAKRAGKAMIEIGNPRDPDANIGSAPSSLADNHIKTIYTVDQAWTLVDRIRRESKELGLAARRPNFLGTGDPHWQQIDSDFAVLSGIMKSPEFLNLGASLVERERAILQGAIGKGPDHWLREDPINRLTRSQQQIEDRARSYANTAKLKYWLPKSEAGEEGGSGGEYVAPGERSR